MKTLSIIASLLLAVSAFGQAVSRTELKATNTLLLAAINTASNSLFARLPEFYLSDYGFATNNTAAANWTASSNCLRAWYAAGGGTIVSARGRFTNAWPEIPNDSGNPPYHPPLWLKGMGSEHNMVLAPNGGTRWEMPGTNSFNSKMHFGPFGNVLISDINFENEGGAQDKPFIYTEFSRLHIFRNGFFGGASFQGTNARQAGIVLGSTNSFSNYTNANGTGEFQGYQSIIEHNTFGRIGTAIEFNKSANQNVFQQNLIRNDSGGTNPAVTVLNNTVGSTVGNLIAGNTFEVTGYLAPFIKLDGASFTILRDNGYYDPAAGITQTIYEITNSSSVRLEDSFIDTSFKKWMHAPIIAGVEVRTADQGGTNYANNYWRHSVTVRYDASVPFAMMATDQSYTYPELSNDRVTWRWVSSDGTQNREIVRTSNIGELGATNFTMFGSSSNNSPVAALGVNASGNFTRMAIGSGSGTPGGSSLQVQYNTNSTFAGDAGLTYDPVTDALTAGSFHATGSTTDGHFALTNLTGFWTAFAPTNAARSHTNVWETWPVIPTQVFVPVGTNGGRVHWRGTPVKIDANGNLTGVQGITDITGVISQDTGTGTADLGATTTTTFNPSGSATFTASAEFNGGVNIGSLVVDTNLARGLFIQLVETNSTVNSNLTFTAGVAVRVFVTNGLSATNWTFSSTLVTDTEIVFEPQAVDRVFIAPTNGVNAFGMRWHSNLDGTIGHWGTLTAGVTYVWAVKQRGTNFFDRMTAWQ